MKRLFYVLSAAVLLFSMAFMTACRNNTNQKEEKYDVIIKIKNSLGDEWIFDLDTDEFTWEHEYTGEEIKFMVDTYNMPQHPRYSEEWFAPSGNHDGIGGSCLYYDVNGTPEKSSRSFFPAKEDGEYHYVFWADGTLFKFRSVRLYVTIH